MNNQEIKVKPARRIGEVIILPEKRIPALVETEVLVVGGGVAGIAAAIACARSGIKTILVERYGYLGGMATGGLVLSMEGFGDGEKQVIKGVAAEIVECLSGAKEFNRYSNGFDGTFDPEALKYIALKLLLNAGVKLLFHAYFTDAIVNRDKIEGIIISTKLGPKAILSKAVIDATGDGDVFAFSGALYEKGLKGIGLNFRLGNVDLDLADKFRKENQKEYEKLNRKLAGEGGFEPHVYPTVKKGIVWWNNMLSPEDGLNVEALSKMEILLREKINTTLKFMKNNFPGFKDAYLIDTSPQLGIRETRRLIGEYVLTEKDVLKGKRFSDAVVHAGYLGKIGVGYDIPYRCLLPKNIEGLVVAGRCISVDHYTQDAIRIIANCFAIGEAAGYAATISIKEKTSLHDLNTEELKKLLIANDIFLN
ncbi:MAG: FAD-dependent oxidoreductase [bacterium]|nr:FAD-dependent oxidoreductase [bacterium]